MLQTIPEAVFTLGEQLDAAAAMQRLQSLAFVDRRATATAQTLDFVAQRVLSAALGRRSAVPAVVVIMAGSESQDTAEALQQAVSGLHGTGARVIVVGTASTTQEITEMELMASSASDVYEVGQLEGLVSLNASLLGQQLFAPFVCNGTQPVASSSAAPVASSSTPLVSVQPSSSVFVEPSFDSALPVSTSSSVGELSTIGTAPSSSVIATTTPPTTTAPTTTSTFPLPTYCSPFQTQDVVFVVSASGQTGADVFARFINLGVSMIQQLPGGTATTR